jgi:glycosyltransferase involved in cell wall biosynthesis
VLTVSCIMPTRDRRAFVPRALAQFLAQDYPDRELIVVDDGADSIADLVPEDSRIRVVRHDKRMTVGAKRNIACEMATGAVMAHWDDDDWMAPWRLSYQMDAIAGGADVCGLARLYFYDAEHRRAWEYQYGPATRGWVAGATLCYRREIWRTHRFPDVNEGEDTRFVWGLRGVPLQALGDHRFYVATVHRGNTSRKRTDERRYRPVCADVVEQLMRLEGKT